jgi:lipoprotein-releasing system permease protein
MRFEYLIGMRYLRARRRERFVSLIALISLGGVAIGTFALTVVLAVMSGLQEDLRDRLLALNPHVVVTTTDPAAAASQPALQRRIEELAGVVGVAPYISSQVMVVSTTPTGIPAYVSGGTMRGVIAQNNPVLRELQRTLVAGSLAALARSYAITVSDHGVKHSVNLPGVIVGKSLASDLGVRIGNPMIVISPASLGAAAGAPRLRRFVVVGLFRSGMYEFDSALMFAPLASTQALLADYPQADSGLEVRVSDLFAAPAIARQIGAIAGASYTVRDWTQNNAPLFEALKLETFTYFLVLLLIVLVAAFNIVATLVMVVMERRKEIAILRAMGARASSIAWIFLCEGAALGVGGTALGVGVGFLTALAIGKYHLVQLPPDLFIVSVLPVRLYPVNFVAVAIAAIALCIGGALYPALKARALSPVEVIRYE